MIDWLRLKVLAGCARVEEALTKRFSFSLRSSYWKEEAINDRNTHEGPAVTWCITRAFHAIILYILRAAPDADAEKGNSIFRSWLRTTVSRWNIKDPNARFWDPNLPRVGGGGNLTCCEDAGSAPLTLSKWIFHFSCGIRIWLRRRAAPSPTSLLTHGGQLWLLPGVEMGGSQECTSKASREVCTVSSWSWPQMHALWAA